MEIVDYSTFRQSYWKIILTTLRCGIYGSTYCNLCEKQSERAPKLSPTPVADHPVEQRCIYGDLPVSARIRIPMGLNSLAYF